MKSARLVALFAVSLSTPTLSIAASSPFGIATPDSPAGNGVTGPAAPLLLVAMRLQTLFYQKLTSALDAFSSDPHAGLWLIGLSFLYGIFHAVGPGHGKAVIASFVLATGERLKQATMMSIIASLLQALSAIVIVFSATAIFDATATQITSVTDMLEIGSYGLIMLLGLTLVASKGRRFAHEWRRERRQGSSFSCEGLEDRSRPSSGAGLTSVGFHRHGADCGCFAIGRLVIARPQISLRERLQAIISVGIRPCSGALIVLVFSIARHLALAGVMSVFAMAAGTASTVTLAAAFSVWARQSLARLALSQQGVKPRVAAGFELAAACFVLFFGMMMLIGLAAADGWV